MNEEKELTAKEEAFCVAYTTIGSETFSNGAKSAIEAKYAEDSARTQAWRMLKKEHIKKRIIELYDKNMQENMVTVGSVLANLNHDRQMARKHNQYNVAKACTELEGKYLAMFTERHDVKQIQTSKVEFISSKEGLDGLIKNLRERATLLIKKVDDGSKLTNEEKVDLIELDLLERQKALGNAICTG